MKTLVSVPDSNAGRSPIHLWCLAENWQNALRPVNTPPSKGVSISSVPPADLLFFIVYIRQFRAPVHFLVLASMRVDCVLEGFFSEAMSRQLYRRSKKPFLSRDSCCLSRRWTADDRSDL